MSSVIIGSDNRDDTRYRNEILLKGLTSRFSTYVKRLQSGIALTRGIFASGKLDICMRAQQVDQAGGCGSLRR